MPIASDGNGKYLALGDDGKWQPARMAHNPETGDVMIHDGSKWIAEPHPTSGGGALLRGAAQGATFGFGDELEAGKDALAQGVRNLPGVGTVVRGVRSAFGFENPEDHPTIKGLMEKELLGKDGSASPSMADTYTKSLQNERRDLHADTEQHPVLATVGQVAGGIGGAVAGSLLAPQVALPAAAGRAGAAVNTLWQAAPQAVRTGLGWIGGGAASGGLAGFGEGEGGFGNRLGSAATGAAVGAAVAPVAGAVANVGSKVAGRVIDATGFRNADVLADRKIAQSLGRDANGADTAVEDAITRSTAAGDAPVAVVDLGGRGTVNLGATASNTPSQAMQVADQFVELRRGGRPDRLMASGDEAFGGGSGADIAETGAALRAQRTADSDPLYTEAFSQPAGMTENMGHILNDPIGQQGLQRGLEIQRIENNARRARGEAAVPTEDPAIRYNEAGDPEIVGVPNMRSLDAVKRGMDAILEDARDKTSGRITMTERLRAIDDMRRTWVGLLDQGSPDYAQARAAWGGPSAQLEATSAGRTALRTDRDVVARRMEAQPDVQDAYRLGAGRDFADRVSDPAKASGAARLLLEDRQMQQRLESLIPDPAQRNAFINSLRQETNMTAVERAVGPRAGSQTARILAGGDDLSRDVSPWLVALGQAAAGHYGGAVATGARDIGRRLGQGVNSTTADALANRLFATDAGRRGEILRNVLAQRDLDAARTLARRNQLAIALRGTSTGLGGAVGGGR